MNEIINSILEAEKKADDILKTATEKSKTDILESDDKAENIKEEAVSELKTFKKESILKYNNIADEKYQEIIKKGNSDAELLKEKSDGKIESVADFVVGRIFD